MNSRSFLRASRIWRVAEEVNRGVVAGTGRVVSGDARATLRGSDAEVAFLDPPYAGTDEYRRTYQLLDQLLGDAVDASPAADARAKMRSLIGMAEADSSVDNLPLESVV